MKFKGLLLKESLQDLNILKLVKIIKTEKWNIPKERLADFQPKIWTAITFEGDMKNIKEIALKMSKVIKPKWYLNIEISNKKIVIFHNKIFDYRKEDDKEKKKSIDYGKSIGIPECQLDY